VAARPFRSLTLDRPLGVAALSSKLGVLNDQQRFGNARNGELSQRGRGQSVAGDTRTGGWSARASGNPCRAVQASSTISTGG